MNRGVAVVAGCFLVGADTRDPRRQRHIPAAVAKLRDQYEGEVQVHASAGLAQKLHAQRLIDEYGCSARRVDIPGKWPAIVSNGHVVGRQLGQSTSRATGPSMRHGPRGR